MRAHIGAWVAVLLLAACGGQQAGAPAPDRAGGPVSHPRGEWRKVGPTPREFGQYDGLAFWTGDEVLVASGPDIMTLAPHGSELELVTSVPQSEECEGCGYGQAAVWTGEKLVMWGGGFSFAGDAGAATQGASFAPAGRRLEPVPVAPIPVRWWHTAVWTGTEMIVWGGSDDNESEGTRGCPSTFVDGGAAYDPQSDRWRNLAPAPIEGRMLHEAVWTGTEMIVWGGSNGDCAGKHPVDGASYDPALNEWREIATSPVRGRSFFDAAWTGEEMILWGGSVAGRSLRFDDGAAYDPRSDSWRVLPDAPMKARDYPALAWTGTELIVWGGCCGAGMHRDGAVYRP